MVAEAGEDGKIGEHSAVDVATAVPEHGREDAGKGGGHGDGGDDGELGVCFVVEFNGLERVEFESEEVEVDVGGEVEFGEGGLRGHSAGGEKGFENVFDEVDGEHSFFGIEFEEGGERPFLDVLREGELGDDGFDVVGASGKESENGGEHCACGGAVDGANVGHGEGSASNVFKDGAEKSKAHDATAGKDEVAYGAMGGGGHGWYRVCVVLKKKQNLLNRFCAGKMKWESGRRGKGQ